MEIVFCCCAWQLLPSMQDFIWHTHSLYSLPRVAKLEFFSNLIYFVSCRSFEWSHAKLKVDAESSEFHSQTVWSLSLGSTQAGQLFTSKCHWVSGLDPDSGNLSTFMFEGYFLCYQSFRIHFFIRTKPSQHTEPQYTWAACVWTWV